MPGVPGAGAGLTLHRWASCQTQGLTYGIAYAAMIASDQGGICGFLQANQNKASARSVNLAVVKIDPTGSTASITTGAYPVVANPSVETTGSFDAPACAVTFPGDVCTGDIGPVNPTCAP